MNDKIQIRIVSENKDFNLGNSYSIIENSIPKWVDFFFEFNDDLGITIDILAFLENRIDVLLCSKKKLFVKETFYTRGDTMPVETGLEYLWNRILCTLILSGAVKCIDDVKHLNK